MSEEFSKHDTVLVQILRKLHAKLEPIAEEMNIELRMVEDINQTTIMFVPKVDELDWKDWAKLASYKVVENLLDRRGIRQALEEIDDDIMEEMIEDIAKIIRSSYEQYKDK